MYGSAAEFTTYHESRGRTVPGTWDDTYIEAALLVASEWLDTKYGGRFYGYPTDGYSQARQWPRTSAITNTFPTYVFATDEIPTDVKYAAYEAAWREANTPESLNVDFTSSKYNSVSIDGAIAVEYNTNLDVSSIQKQIGIVEGLLNSLFDPEKTSSSLSGSISRV